MKKTILLALTSLLTLGFLSGCSNSEKVAIISTSVRLAATVGTGIAVTKEPETAKYLKTTADIIEYTIIKSLDSEVILSELEKYIDENVKEEQYRLLINTGLAEALSIYDAFFKENVSEKFDEQKKQVALALVGGIRAGLVITDTELSASSSEYSTLKSSLNKNIDSSAFKLK